MIDLKKEAPECQLNRVREKLGELSDEIKLLVIGELKKKHYERERGRLLTLRRALNAVHLALFEIK